MNDLMKIGSNLPGYIAGLFSVSLSINSLPMKHLTFLFLILSFHVCHAQPTPSIQFTSVPGWGTSNLLYGVVHNTTPANHGVAVYIFLEEAGGWWNKPYASAPVTLIGADSTFNTQIALAETDPFATRIIAFLIPLSFYPPVQSGGDLPEELFSFPYVTSCRPHGTRTLSWSGLEWTVKKSIASGFYPIGPGPNLFNDHDSMVWVDSQQKLHLRIAKNGGTWYCSELICNASLGYQQYRFEVESRVDIFDKNTVVGMFTWDDCSPLAIPPNPNFREIDFEFSRWGDAANDNSQYVIQPYNVPGNLHRFHMNLAGITHSVHTFDWRADAIDFNSSWGSASHSWKYTNPAYIPTPGYENVRINFWLINGGAPSDNRPSELVLNSFLTNVSEPQTSSAGIRVFPNPVETGCVIEIQSDRVKEVVIGIMDVLGNHIRNPFHVCLVPGSNRVEWDGNTAQGKPAGPGIYLVFLRDKSEIRVVRIVKINW
jgi:hypothetical protein